MENLLPFPMVLPFLMALAVPWLSCLGTWALWGHRDPLDGSFPHPPCKAANRKRVSTGSWCHPERKVP